MKRPAIFHTNMINDSVQEVSHMAGDAASKTGNISAATEEQVASMEEISASAATLANLLGNPRIRN
ncbi:hypothetical protein M3612_20260 [Niallia taxi]|uniref:hypothetical protein n=1 Tax=Niallia taxi TaxID=2499688 RepID=UPI00203C9D23|nr:hypothetical protein [Niallia taxi]MCM3216824.1 hypothetical protein [Niallia taxi]